MTSAGFSSRMLRSGIGQHDAAALGALHDLRRDRRPDRSRTGLSLKPPRPCCAPWHAPWLQPAFVRIGTISRRKLTGMSAVDFFTVTGIVAFAPFASMVMVVLPSPTGRTMPRSAVATFAFADGQVADAGQIQLAAVGPDTEHDEPLLVPRPGELHRRGVNDEFLRRACRHSRRRPTRKPAARTTAAASVRGRWLPESQSEARAGGSVSLVQSRRDN